MVEQKQQTVLEKLKTALADVPEEYHEPVSQMLAHDIGVIARTINIIVNQPVA